MNTPKDEIVPATLADYVDVFGFCPNLSFQGFAVRRNGCAVAIAGIYITNNLPFVFCQINAAVRKRTVLRVAYAVMQIARRKKLPLFALRDPEVTTSEQFIKHFGFMCVGEIEGKEIFSWQP